MTVDTASYCTGSVFCLEFCGESRQKQPPYKIDMEFCSKDEYSLFESRLQRNLDPNSECTRVFVLRTAFNIPHFSSVALGSGEPSEI